MILTVLQTTASPTTQRQRWRERAGTANWRWTSWSLGGKPPGSEEEPSTWGADLKKKNHLTVFNNVQKTIQINRLKLGKIFEISLYLVTLKMRSSRRARNTLIPKDVPGLMVAHTTSKMLPTITCRHTTRHDTVCWLHWCQWVKLKKEKRLNLCYWHLPLSS